MAEKRTAALRRKEWMKGHCPTCGVVPGVRCYVSPAEGTIDIVHQSRVMLRQKLLGITMANVAVISFSIEEIQLFKQLNDIP